MSTPLVRLDSIAKVVIGATPARNRAEFWGGDNVWVSIAELNGGIITDSREHITDLGVKESPSKLVPAGSILFSFKLSIGKMATAGVPLYTNEAIAAISVLDEAIVYPRYLYHALGCLNAGIEAHTAVMGAMLNSAKVRALEVPLPPLDEQRRIAHLLDEADRLQRLRKEANEKAQGILPALFVDMFGDPETNPMGWGVATLGDKKFVTMLGGGTPSKARHDFWGGSIPWVSSKDVKALFLEDTADHITEDGVAGSAAKLTPERATVIVMRSGILAHTAPVAMLMRPMTVNQDQKVLVANQKTLLPEFLFGTVLCLRPRILAAVRKGATVHNIELNDIKKMPLLVPPMDEQRRFTETIRVVHDMYAHEESATRMTSSSMATLRSRLFAEAV